MTSNPQPRGAKNDHIPLVDAVRRLGLSYNQAHRLLLIGKLKGGRVRGRWMVECEDLEQMAVSANIEALGKEYDPAPVQQPDAEPGRTTGKLG